MRTINLFVKRMSDITFGLLGLIILMPLNILVCGLIKITMPGPIFFKQDRVGKNKKCFKILKFRTMKVDKKAESQHDFSKDVERLTTLGKILRRLKIDELPQLINVIKGDMSLVGPRPTVMEQVEMYTDYQMQRLKMRPGMTGMAQIHGNTALNWEERIHYDIKYINEFNIFIDIKILVKTILVVILGEERFKRSFDENNSNRIGNF